MADYFAVWIIHHDPATRSAWVVNGGMDSLRAQ
jgi:inhibitor of KinA sporulation pathway (predicted exonuclease)